MEATAIASYIGYLSVMIIIISERSMFILVMIPKSHELPFVLS